MVKNLSLVTLLIGVVAATPIQHEARQFPGVGLNVDQEGNVDLKPQSGVDVNVDPQKESGKGAGVNVNGDGVKVDPKNRPQRRNPQFPGIGLNVDQEGNVDLRPQSGVDVNVDPQKDSGKGAGVNVNGDGVKVDPKNRPEKRDPQFPGVGLNVDQEGNVDLRPQSGVDVNVDPQKDSGKGAGVNVNGDGVKVDPKNRPEKRALDTIEKRALEGIERPVIGGGSN
ncbi:hypothetical protein IWZ01DRAFT_478278 [Phyllosticta capitalensis]